MHKVAAITLFACSCTVPLIGDLSPKRCDAAHPCAAGFACASSGFCEPSGSSPCDGGAMPSDETCDGFDNDCDGSTDEGLFDTNACELGMGVCAAKRHACVGGRFETTCGSASYGADWEAFESRCDGKDNDCDGNTDESGGMCTPQGVCLGQIATCAGVCMASGYEATETSCDGRDNDCDGSSDEGLVNAVACTLSAGVCAGKNQACVGDGGFEPVCTALSYGTDYQATEARCDGLDNDCNGTVDRRPDGGAIGMGGACELTVGVCVGAQRACADGGPETPCTALSYGPSFQTIEVTCDGADNDCDGQPDRSPEFVLAAGPTTQTHLSVVAGTTSVAVVYADDSNGTKKVLFKRVYSGAPSATVDLSDPQAMSSTRPSMVAFGGNQAIATWLDADGTGATRVRLARLDTIDGGTGWSRVVSSGRTVFGSPRIAVASVTSPVVVWIDAPSSTLRAAVYDASGNLTQAPRVLSTPTLSDGGFVEQVLAADVVDSAAGVAVGWASFQGGDSLVRLRHYDASLVQQGASLDANQLSEVARALRVSRRGSAVSAAWAGGSTNVRYVGPDGGVQLVAATTGTVNDLAVDGDFVVWSEGAAMARLRGARVGAASQQLTSNGTALSPSLAPSPAGAIVIGYELDIGAGFDLRAQTVCPP